MKQKKSKKSIIIIVAVVVVLIAIFASLGGNDDKKSDNQPAASSEKKDKEDDTLVTTWTTKSGQECKVYTEAPLDYRAAVIKTINDLVPDANTDKLNSTDGWSFSLYDDGMAQISTPNIYLNGYEYGSTVMMKFKDDSHTDYSVHYLKVGPDTYKDDGSINAEAYAEP